MLIIVRWFLKVFNNEHEFRTRYNRAHPHFVRYMLVDAVISIVIVISAFQLFANGSGSAQLLPPMEVGVVSSSDLISHARSGNIDAFWLGPVKGYKYTLNDQVLRIVDIFYWPGESGNRNAKQYLYEVKTYESQDVWDTHTHPIRASANTTTIVVNKNISIKINQSSMKGVIVTYMDKPEIVAIAYPERQTLDNMIKNVKSLKLVR